MSAWAWVLVWFVAAGVVATWNHVVLPLGDWLADRWRSRGRPRDVLVIHFEGVQPVCTNCTEPTTRILPRKIGNRIEGMCAKCVDALAGRAA